MTVHNGIANYWIANEVSVRSADINVLTGLTVENQPGYWLHNDNAWELCDLEAAEIERRLRLLEERATRDAKLYSSNSRWNLNAGSAKTYNDMKTALVS